jgi:hypothetical protein
MAFGLNPRYSWNLNPESISQENFIVVAADAARRMNRNIMRKIFFLALISISVHNHSSAQAFNVSEAEALKAAKAIEASIKERNPTVLGNFFDLPVLIERIKEKSIQATKSEEMFQGFKSTFKMDYFGTQMVDASEDGSYELLRSYETQGKRHLLFRMFGKHGINYHDYLLIKVGQQVKAADVYVYLTGEEMSTTMGDLIDASVSSNATLYEMPENLRTLLKFRQYQKVNDNNAIIKLYDSLNEDYKKNKAIQIIYLNACKRVDIKSERYKNALENYAATFPDDASTPLMMIDLYFLTKEYEKDLYAINKLDSLVKDPFLDFFRAGVYLMQDNKKQAKTTYDTVFQQYPAISYTIENLVVLHMQDGEISIAKAALDTYKKTDGFKQKYVDDLYLMYPELKN